MEPKELNQLLLSEFPELQEKFEEVTSWQDGINTGCFITFEDIFMPFLRKNVEMNNKDMIERLYSFIEQLCDIDDPYAQNLLYVAILENIGSNNDPNPFEIYLKPKSLKIYLENYKY